ncbi:MAG: DUF1778 domain-containing protein [Azoarcus sp.]|nr:DUF1778 domain-containing protein [Azoarcus sp.]
MDSPNKHAAGIQGRTMTDFMVSAARDAAMHAIEQAEVIRLSLTDQKRFTEALLSPPRPSAAFYRHYEFIELAGYSLKFFLPLATV